MSKREGKILSLTGIDISQLSQTQMQEYFKSCLDSGIHGIGFSAYREGQEPGDQLDIQQIRERMTILKPHTGWVRSFSCCLGNENVPIIAKQMGIKTLAGAWLGDNLEKK